MIRKQTAIAMAMGISVLGASSCALAGDFAFTPRAEVGMTSYSYEKVRNHSTGADKVRDLSDTMFTGTIGATVSMNGFYLDGYWQGTGEGSDDYSSSSVVSDYRWETASDFDRQEYAATLGYGFNNGIKLFTGYQASEVQFDEYQDVYFQSTGVKSSSSFTYDYNLEGKGTFIGVGYGMAVGTGVLSGAVSYIWLDADYDEKADEYWNGVYYESQSQTSSHDGSGFKVGVAWNAPITDQISYGVTVNGQWNSYDAALPNGYLNYAAGNDPQEHDETIVTAMASISYSFGTK